MSVERDIRYELLARLCPNSTGKETFLLLLFTVESVTTSGHSGHLFPKILKLYSSSMITLNFKFGFSFFPVMRCVTFLIKTGKHNYIHYIV